MPDTRRVGRPIPEPSTLVVEIAGCIDRADISALCERVRIDIEASAAALVICDVGGLAHPDCAAVDALARITLITSRLGRPLQLRNVSPELRSLLCFVGLDEVMGEGAGSAVEARGQPE